MTIEIKVSPKINSLYLRMLRHLAAQVDNDILVGLTELWTGGMIMVTAADYAGECVLVGPDEGGGDWTVYRGEGALYEYLDKNLFIPIGMADT